MVGAAMSGNQPGIEDDLAEGPVAGVVHDEQPPGVKDDLQRQLG